MQILPFLRRLRPITLIVGVACGIACLPEAYASASFVQAVASSASGTTKSLSLSFPNKTIAGDLILIGFDYDTNSLPMSLTDSQGNSFTRVGTQVTSPGGARSVVYSAKNIKGGADAVTVNLSANSAYLEVYLSEYGGVDQTNPIEIGRASCR